jgi:hypothetical protein
MVPVGPGGIPDARSRSRPSLPPPPLARTRLRRASSGIASGG